MATGSESDHGREIVLGNKQLLSLFFVIVVLFGVVFTIGYMIGKNSANVSAASLVNGGAPAVASSRPPAVTAPASSPAESEPSEAAKTEEPAPAPKPRAEETVKTEEPKPASPVSAASGSYLQVAALKRPDADHIVKVLRDRGFPALLGESPKEGLFRVLVGPFKNMTDLADSKGKLRSAGFETIVAR